MMALWKFNQRSLPHGTTSKVVGIRLESKEEKYNIELDKPEETSNSSEPAAPSSNVMQTPPCQDKELFTKCPQALPLSCQFYSTAKCLAADNIASRSVESFEECGAVPGVKFYRIKSEQINKMA